MPQHKSCKKRVITSEKANARNRAMRSRIKTVTKKLKAATTVEQATAVLQEAYSVLDKAAKSRVIHKNKASNQKSKLAAFVKTVA